MIATDLSSPTAALEAVMRLWPKEGCAECEPDVLRQRLAPYLTPDFDSVDLLNRPEGEFGIFSAALVYEDAACVLVFDTADTDWPHRAILVRTPDNRWLLKSFEFECPACFSTGVLDKQPCYLCGAHGWGAKERIRM
jgi:hypothetical protein